MKSLNMKTLSLSLFLALSLNLSAAWSAPVSCASFHSQAELITRSGLSRVLLQRDIPNVAVPTRNGPIPAILLNTETSPKLGSVLDTSLGTVVSYQPGYNNDHGILRVQRTLADLDSPGGRSRGELHKTGISWSPLEEYLAYSKNRNRIRIEVAYALTQDESNTVVIYHRMRRAAIIRVPFRFGGAVVEKGKPNTLENAGEHCFIFCSGSGVSSQVREMESKIAAYGMGSATEILQRTDVQNWLMDVKFALSKADKNDAQALSPLISLNAGVPESLIEGLSRMEKIQKVEFLNWLAGYQFSVDYSKVLQTLQVPGDNGYQGIHSPRAVAVLVYDGVVSPRDFVSPNYEAKGVFSNWGHAQMQKPADAFPEPELVTRPAAPMPPPAAPLPMESPPKKGFLQKLKDLFL
jgi:hypothetical protein